MTAHTKPHITMLGGGTGSFTLLQELKHATPNISALVNMSDDGGSSGRLRDELGVLPPGDIRQCLVALSDAPEMRDMFSYRFQEGSFAGHSLGNVILSGLELQQGGFAEAVKVASSILNIRGEVIPITTQTHQLVMEDGSETVRGEYVIGHRAITSADARLRLEPEAVINPEAEEAIARADLLVIAPGNLYGSLLPILCVRGVPEALRATKAHKVMVANLMNKPGQTDGWNPVDYVKKVEEYIGESQIDTLLWNSELPAQDLYLRYAAEGELPVEQEDGAKRYDEVRANIIRTDLIANEPFVPDPHDKAIPRTLIRHDARKVSEALMRIYHELR